MLPCKPCAAIQVEDPAALLPQLELEPTLSAEDILFVAWDLTLDGTADTDDAKALEQAGATPWLRLHFTTPAPLSANLDRLETELEQVSVLAAAAGDEAHFQILWHPEGADSAELLVTDYAFLVKRAAVAITGAQVAAQVISQPLPPDPQLLRDLYSEEIAAYLEGVALRPGDPANEKTAIDLLMELDPGSAIISDSVPYPEPTWDSLPRAAEQAALGYGISVFDATSSKPSSITPLKLLAAEFQGDLSFDPYSSPVGSTGVQGWSFVRGEDLDLRVIVESATVGDEISLTFSDRPLELRKWTIRDAQDNHTQVTLQNTRFGGKLPSKLFKFVEQPDKTTPE